MFCDTLGSPAKDIDLYRLGSNPGIALDEG